ncbi:MAG: beta-lactamase hydrolase domain-containing protein [Phycisphaerae bacterium]
MAVLTASGCARSLHKAPVALAQPVTDWAGLERLFQDGDIFFGGQPTAEALEAAPQRGIKVVVNMRSAPEIKALDFDEPALVRRLGMEYVAIPVTPSTFGPDDADRLKDVLRKTAGPVLLHCGSSNRVGAVWALYLYRHRGIALDDAIKLGRKAGLRSERLVETIRQSANQ